MPLKSSPPKAPSLGAVLVRQGRVTEEQLGRALEAQRGASAKLGHILVVQQVISEDDLVRALAEQLGLPVFPISANLKIDPRIVSLVPEPLARKHKAIAVEREGDRVTVAMADPLDLLALDDLRALTGGEIVPVISKETEIEQALDRLYRESQTFFEIEDALAGVELEPGAKIEEQDMTEAELRTQADDAPVVRLVGNIISQAIAERATDIHIEPTKVNLLVRFRVDGVLYDMMSPHRTLHMPLVTRIKILADMDIADRRLPQDGRFSVRAGAREVDVRVSTLPTVYGEKVVLRLLEKSGFQVSLERLGFEPEVLESFNTAIRRPHGMILVSGPTGSGKSTTLYAALSELRSTRENITTVEDPVEYLLDRVNQVRTNEKAGLTFASALRSILRQDPDIIMVGEIRDLETAQMAVRSALTGHLVFSTVHANDAAATATRLVDIGVEPFLVASAVNMVLAQRLVRKICASCREEDDPDPSLLSILGIDSVLASGMKFWRGRGCGECKQRGYLGRTAVYESLALDRDVKQLIAEKATADQLFEAGRIRGMVTLRESGIRKVATGVTTVEEVAAILQESE